MLVMEQQMLQISLVRCWLSNANASNSNFMGFQLGKEATSAQFSNFFGYSFIKQQMLIQISLVLQAGYRQLMLNIQRLLVRCWFFKQLVASNSNFFGQSAGIGATNACIQI
jgi:hypothetical protein